jgi:hypothetical protein
VCAFGGGVDDGAEVSDVVAQSSIEEVTARLLDAKHALGLDRVHGQIQPAFQRRAPVGLEGGVARPIVVLRWMVSDLRRRRRRSERDERHYDGPENDHRQEDRSERQIDAD